MFSTFLSCSQMSVACYHSVIHGLGFFIYWIFVKGGARGEESEANFALSREIEWTILCVFEFFTKTVNEEDACFRVPQRFSLPQSCAKEKSSGAEVGKTTQIIFVSRPIFCLFVLSFVYSCYFVYLWIAHEQSLLKALHLFYPLLWLLLLSACLLGFSLQARETGKWKTKS